MLLRGIWYRGGRSAVVVGLAAVAVAAAVLVPGFTRAAQQSVLTDRLAATPAAATGLTFTATGTAALRPAAHQPPEELALAVAAALAGVPVFRDGDLLADPVAGLDVDTTLRPADGAGAELAARLAYRDRVCPQLMIRGECPSGPGEVLLSTRTAEANQLAVGDRLVVELAEQTRPVTVVGTYQPVAPSAAYWGRTVYFGYGGFDPVSGAARVDALFTGDPGDVLADPGAEVTAAVTYPLRGSQVRLDHHPALARALAGLHDAARGSGLELVTEAPGVLAAAEQDQQAIARTAPVLAVPLLLLSWFVLFLLVAAVTQERGREIGLARLRGFTSGQANRFALREVLLLVAVAGPLGLGLGLAAVALAARTALADGVLVELRGPVLVAAAGALVAAGLAVVVAGRTSRRRGVLALLRRVPQRASWRAGALEGVVVALAVSSLVALLGERSSPLALLAPAALAVAVGIAVARLVGLLAGRRLRGRHPAGRRGQRLPGLLAAAALARRPIGRQVIVVVTAAVAVLSFAALAWDVAAQARQDRAVDLLGADRVYTVHAEHPAALQAAVAAADPAGGAMAVVRASGQYGGAPIELLAVEAAALPAVVSWRAPPRSGLAALAAALRPQEPAPLLVADELAVTARVSELGAEPVRLTALLSAPGEPPRSVPLGTLAEDRQRYAAAVPGCGSGCRLLGFGLGRAGAAGPFEATVELVELRSGGRVLADRFDDPAAWSVPPAAQLRPGPALTLSAATGFAADLTLSYQDTPAAVPVVLAGPTPADDPAASEFRFPGLGERPEQFVVAARAERLPRAGDQAMLFDLAYAVAAAERTAALADDAGLRYEVWAGPAAPADLPERLAAAGAPVRAAESVTGTAAQLGRQAPALSWWLGLLAAGAAVALAVGTVALSGRVQLAERRADLAALRDTGVPARVLRRALWREYAALAGVPLLAGVVVGTVAAGLLLPGLPLVETGLVDQLPAGVPRLRAVPAAALAVAIGLGLAGLAAARLPGAGSARAGAR